MEERNSEITIKKGKRLMSNTPHIIVLSYSRSGSNLLTAILAEGTNGTINLETPTSIHFRKALKANSISAKIWNQMHQLLTKKERSFIPETSKYDVSKSDSGIDSLLHFYARATFNSSLDNSNCLVEKYTKHALFCKKLEQTFPKAKFIILIRDCADVVERRFANNMAKNKSLVYQAKLWDINYQKLFNFKQLHPNKTHVVKFEDLMDDATLTLHKLDDFLNLPENTLKFNANRVEDLGEMLNANIMEKGKHNAINQLSTSNEKTLKLTQAQRLKIELLTQSTRKNFGYPTSESAQQSLSAAEKRSALKAKFMRNWVFYRYHLLPPGVILFFRKIRGER